MSKINGRITSLQALLKEQGLDAWLQPTQDRFLSEYPPESSKRLAWLTGFDGSAGAALVLAEPIEGKSAALFTDGRYTLQAQQQLDATLFHVIDTAQESAAAWLARNKPHAHMGFDAQLHSHQQVQGFEGICPKPCPNLVDILWHDRPAEPTSAAKMHDLRYAGWSSEAKLAQLFAELDAKVDALFLGMPDGINWLFNMRGDDSAFNPLVLCYALLRRHQPPLLITQKRTFDAALPTMTFMDIEDFYSNPSSVFSGISAVQMDATSVVEKVWQGAMDAGCTLITREDPTLLLKAVKHPVEIEGIRAAHRRDGRALSRFLAWAESQENLTELEAARRLEAFRIEESGDHYLGASFETIAGSGAHGAIVHYRATEQSNRSLAHGELFLIDSGAQYPDGTTDVTRTWVKGTPSAEMIDRYTRVLKGHIALASAVFPEGTTGGQLDALARQFLWQVGADYAHGTGHGVGCYLCVHEGPQRISKRGGDVPLRAGMVLSNEPGFYKTGSYGIRLENLVLVIPADEEGFLCFETLTLAPFARALIDTSMLTHAEQAWLEAYEARVSANNKA